MKQRTSHAQTILVVEDEKSIQAILSQFLGNSYKIHVCNNGLSALTYLHTHSLPALVITDLDMPGLNGMDMVSQMKISPYFNNIPILVLSAGQTVDTRVGLLELGVDATMDKPFNPLELHSRIVGIMRHYQPLKRERFTVQYSAPGRLYRLNEYLNNAFGIFKAA